MASLLEFVLDHLPDSVYATNVTGRVLYANRTACRLLQYQRGEIEQLFAWDIDAAFVAAEWSARWALIQENRELRAESRLKRRDGQMLPVAVTRAWGTLALSEAEPQEILVVLARDVAFREDDLERTVHRLLRGRVLRRLDENDLRFFKMLERGATESEIMETLGISRSTYYRTKRRISTKLGIQGSDFSEFWWETEEQEKNE